ncbi:MAG: anhydro-N-acetylmuramic acid kinase [Bacteroidales bacterium]
MNTSYKAIGLMSGTSLDGLDIAYCSFINEENKWSFKIEKANCIPYTPEWIQKLSNADQLSTIEYLNLHNEYGYFLGKECKEFIEKHNIKVDFIASHGHTVFHQPFKHITAQIGSGECIAAASGQNVISDFRAMDIALGGQGAPLVPIGDSLLFVDYDYCINMGGFANLSYQLKNDRIAYDICPVNIMLNSFAQEIGFAYDDKGNLAEKGKIQQSLLDELENISYYQLSHPKSLGKEYLMKEFLPIISKYKMSPFDKLKTFSEHIVSQLLKATACPKKSKLLFTGGGVYNDYIMRQLKLKSNHSIVIPEKTIIDYKEALIFAFLGVLRWRGEINCLKSVTGASRNNIGGKIILAN